MSEWLDDKKLLALRHLRPDGLPWAATVPSIDGGGGRFAAGRREEDNPVLIGGMQSTVKVGSGC